MMTPDVLIVDAIGGSYTSRTLEERGLGGSEIEILQLSTGLTARGHSVVVANGIAEPCEVEGVTYVPLDQVRSHRPSRALYWQRSSSPFIPWALPASLHQVIRANDVYCPPYDVHRERLAHGATLVTNTRWQAGPFATAFPDAAITVIPPMLEPMPSGPKEPGLYVFASGDMKGRDATLDYWRRAKRKTAMRDARLVLVNPGWGTVYFPSTSDMDRYAVTAVEATPTEYRIWIARAEALFMVLTMPETFCCAAALAERAGTRAHILCLAGRGGLDEALTDRRYVTESATTFLGDLPGSPISTAVPIANLTPEALLPEWERTLRLDRPPIVVTKPAPSPFFGELLTQTLPNAIAFGGSEFGMGLLLFSLAAATRATRIVEIGRFKGFSTLALAAACRLQADGWPDPPGADQHRVFRDESARVTSIEINPQPEAVERLEAAGLREYVTCLDVPSAEASVEGPIDLLFIDGGHSLADLRADVRKFVPLVKLGGLIVLHDFFGWFDSAGNNGSPVPIVLAEDFNGFERVLLDTGFASAVLLRKTADLAPALPKMPARADGRPTVGAVLIAKGDEASTVIARAITSAQRIGVDCVTVVCDAPDLTAAVCRQLGADVVMRPSPAIDWVKGIGIIGQARNEALAIAEPRTDYVLVVDADDWLEGALPAVLDREAYEFVIHDGGIEYPRLQLLRSTGTFRYTGIIHEYVQCAGTIGRLETVTYHRGASALGYQDREPPSVKYAKHADLARHWLAMHPDDSRMQFYLGRSLHDAGQLDAAIVAYEARVAMAHGWAEERAYAALEIGKILASQGKDPTAALLRAHALDERRAEPLLLLAQWYRHESRRQFSTALAFAMRATALPLPDSGLFLNRHVYTYEALSEVAVCLYWLGRKSEARGVFEQVAARVPVSLRPWVTEQIAICAREA